MDQTAVESRLLAAWSFEDLAAVRSAIDSIKEEGDDVAVRNAAFFIIDRLRAENRSLEEIDFIKSWLFDRWFTDMRTLLQLTDRWIQATLKIEDFDAMDEAVRFRERFLGTFPKEATMQSFYKAVSLEGKKQYRAALEALDSIPDTLSGAKLASKYLKKAMLLLRIGDQKGATESYQRALLFDPHRQNEIAVLVKADLLAHEGHFAEALETFETFFVKTSQKLRYLDRYIDWNVALSNYEDASRFVETYLPKMLSSQSKNYRIQFFEAVKRLADVIHHEAWQTIAIQAIRNAERPPLREEDCLLELEAFLRQFDESFDEHETIRQLCMILSRHHSFERLHWIRLDQDRAVLWRFHKDRLFETSLQRTPFLDRLIEQEPFESVLFKEDFAECTDYATNQPFSKDLDCAFFVKRRQDPSGLTLLWIAGVSEALATQTVSRALSMTFAIASSQSIHEHLLQTLKRRLDRTSAWTEKHGIAWTTLKNGYLLLENESAKRLFSNDAPMLSFDRVFSRVRYQKPLFPDDFLRTRLLQVQVMGDDGSMSDYHLEAEAEVDCIRLIWTPLLPDTVSSKPLEHPADAEEAIRVLGENATFGWIRFLDGDPFEGQTAHAGERVASLLHSALRTASGALLTWHSFEANRSGWWLVQSIDKRVLTRIAKQTNDILRDRLLQECSIDWDGTLLFSCCAVRPERSLDAIQKALDLRALDVLPDETAVFVDKKTWERLERSNAILVRLEESMKSDRVLLTYQPYADVVGQTYAFFMVSSTDLLEDDKRLFDWTVDRHGLIREHTHAVWKKAMKEFERFYRETKRKMAFAMVVEESFLSVPASARLMTLEAKRRKLPLDMIVVFVRLCKGSITQSLRMEMEYLETKGFGVGVCANDNRVIPVVAALPSRWQFKTDSSLGASILAASRTIVSERKDLPFATVVKTDGPALSMTELIHKWPAQPTNGSKAQ